MSVALTVYWKEFVNQLIKSGRYNNQSEVIRAGLRALQEQELASDVEEFEQIFADGRTGEPDDKAIERTVSRQKAYRRRARAR